LETSERVARTQLPLQMRHNALLQQRTHELLQSLDRQAFLTTDLSLVDSEHPSNGSIQQWFQSAETSGNGSKAQRHHHMPEKLPTELRHDQAHMCTGEHIGKVVVEIWTLAALLQLHKDGLLVTSLLQKLIQQLTNLANLVLVRLPAGHDGKNLMTRFLGAFQCLLCHEFYTMA
jgi:hypothetical protein